MPHRIRFWIYVHPVVPWHTHMRHVLHAEELGFDAVTVADHFGDFAGRRIPFFEMWSQLAAIATATTTVRLAPMVAQIPLRKLPVPASRNRCCGCGLSRGSLSRIWACTGRTAALELAVDADPQRLEINIAQKLQCLREVFRQRNLGSIGQANSRRRLILLWSRRLNICACWPGRSHHLQRVPHRADCSNG